jgi:hypothetical protein
MRPVGLTGGLDIGERGDWIEQRTWEADNLEWITCIAEALYLKRRARALPKHLYNFVVGSELLSELLISGI